MFLPVSGIQFQIALLLVMCPVKQKGSGTADLEKGAVKAIQDLYDVIRYDVLAVNMRLEPDLVTS